MKEGLYTPKQNKKQLEYFENEGTMSDDSVLQKKKKFWHKNTQNYLFNSCPKTNNDK